MTDQLKRLLAAKADEMQLDPVMPPTVGNKIRIRRFATVGAAILGVAAIATSSAALIRSTQERVPPAPQVPKHSDYDIYTMALDGTNVIRVTDDPHDESGPAWSPDGERLAFVRYDEPGRAHIFVTDPGNPEIQMTFGDTVDEAPAWSPDGRYIAFARSDQAEAPRIYLLDTESPRARPRRLISQPGTTTEFWPTWSPDGRRIAFVGNDGTIFVVDVDGGPVVPLVKWRGGFGKIAWGPDGLIAATVMNEDDDVYVVREDGTGLRRVTDLVVPPDGFPSWSPDGSQLVYMTAMPPDGFDEIHIVSVDGTGDRALTENDVNDGLPAWSPDGERIAFSSNR